MDDLVRDIHETLRHYGTLAEEKTDSAGRRFYILAADCPHYGARVTVSFPRPSFHQPPQDAEKKYGFSGIAANYAMPEGLKPVELQAYAEVLGHAVRAGDILSTAQQEKFDEVLLALTARNPVLHQLRLDKSQPDALQDVLIGIASDFNVADMQLFHDTQGIDDFATGAAEKFSKKFPEVTLHWMPAPETFDKIAAQLDKRVVIAVEAPAIKVTAAVLNPPKLPA